MGPSSAPLDTCACEIRVSTWARVYICIYIYLGTVRMAQMPRMRSLSCSFPWLPPPSPLATTPELISYRDARSSERKGRGIVKSAPETGISFSRLLMSASKPVLARRSTRNVLSPSIVSSTQFAPRSGSHTT